VELGGEQPASPPSSPPPPKIRRAAYPAVPAVMMPRPPPLPASLGKQHRQHWLVQAYRGAVADAYKGKRCFVGAKGLKARAAAELQWAAAALIDAGIPPAAWAAYSVDSWDKPGRPPLSWVWNVKRIEYQGDVWDWLDHTGAMSGSQLVGFSALPAKRALIDRYLRSGSSTAAAAQYEADYEGLLLAARHEAALMQQKLNEAAESGRYIWRGL
jgi:hypothetical protein